MSKESLDLADSIIMDAYKNGLSIISTGDNKVVKHRLNLFGEWIEGAYYLNERGFEYALSGCRKGLTEHIERTKEIENLSIKVQDFSAKRQNIAFWLSIIAGVGSIIGIATGCLALYQQLKL